jgi:AraC-like DNA-binding protein
MEPELFCSLMKEDFDRIPPSLRKFADRTGVKPCRIADIITPSMQTALHQILNCPYRGLTRQLFLEGKATELIAYKLAQFESEPAQIYGTTPFDYLRDRRLEKAKIFLDEGNMDVTEVAYTVGYSSLSHFAKVFRQYFGTPPSNYRRNNFRQDNRINMI